MRNFFSNLAYPITIINQFLQGKPKLGLQDTGRFLINTTVGLGGFLDPATTMGLEEHDEDFGQTFGKWGVPAGPYLVVPIWGGVTVRSGAGDSRYRPRTRPRTLPRSPKTSVSACCGRSAVRDELTDAEQLVSGDRYRFIRDAYLQQREYLIADGEIDDPFWIDRPALMPTGRAL